MAEYFPQGKKRMFPHKVVVACACERKHPQQGQPPGTEIAEIALFAEDEGLQGRFKFGTIRPALVNKSSDCEIPVFFSDQNAALAFKLRFG